MFDKIYGRLSSYFCSFMSKKTLSEKDLKDSIKEVRKSLLDSDVAWPVVKFFIDSLKKEVLGKNFVNYSKERGGSLFVEKIHSILSLLFLSVNRKIPLVYLDSGRASIFMFVGLQGSGKTTTCVKVAYYLRKEKKKKVLVVGCDYNRPSAFEQLRLLCEKSGCDFFNFHNRYTNPSDMIRAALEYSNINLYDVVILDTAGRMGHDSDSIEELVFFESLVVPSELFFIVDSMVGRRFKEIVDSFANFLKITGFIITKVDGDSNCGVSFSIPYYYNKPIKFVGFGESFLKLEVFDSSKLVSRILGINNYEGITSVLKSINKSFVFDSKDILDSLRESKKVSFNMDDFRKFVLMLVESGGFKEVSAKVPGSSSYAEALDSKFSSSFLSRMVVVMDSMTLKERLDPSIICSSRKFRISKGSGTTLSDVNKVLKYFNKIKKTKDKMSSKNSKVFGAVKNKFSSVAQG